MSHPKRILFVCIGNSCRSQMAEAFARVYGRGVVEAASAGVYPASRVAPDTLRAMAEKNVDLRGQVPKNVADLDLSKFDLIVDMSDGLLDNGYKVPVEYWEVADPITLEYEQHCQVRDEIEARVKNLIQQCGGKIRGVRVFGLG